MNTFLIIGMVVLFSVISYNLFNKFYYKYNNTKFVTNNEFKSTSKIMEADVILFYTTWCNYSSATKKIWDTLKLNNKYKNNKYDITFIEIDCDTDNQLINEYNIKEYPTIILVKNNKKYIYDANLKEDTFELFINTIMNE